MFAINTFVFMLYLCRNICIQSSMSDVEAPQNSSQEIAPSNGSNWRYFGVAKF